MDLKKNTWILIVFGVIVGGSEGCVKSVEMVEHDIESVTGAYYADVVICCEGYLKNPTTNECEPFCGNCENGICALGECVCNEGFELNLENNRCEPLCTVCLNGVCTAPEVCRCNEGYLPDVIEPNVCQPFCENCSNGRCTQPGLCTCDIGFERDQALQLCIPTTTPSPHANLCGKGYTYHPDTGICEPICEIACDHGFCARPNLCGCEEGFQWSGTSGRCERICKSGYRLINKTDECFGECGTDSCLSGKCSIEGKCLCSDGYDFGSLTECQPICEPPCINGICKEPQICDSLESTDSIENSTDINENIGSDLNETCLVICKNGSCLPPPSCNCPDGFYFDAEGTKTCVPKSSNEWIFILTTVIVIGAIILIAAIIGYNMVHRQRRCGTVSVSHKRDSCFRYSPGKNNIEEYAREAFV